MLASTSHDCKLRLWDMSTERSPRILTHNRGGILEMVSYLPDGQSIAAMSPRENKVKSWDLATGSLTKVLEAMAFSISSDGYFLALSSWTNVNILNIKDNSTMKTLNNDEVSNLALSPNGDTLALVERRSSDKLQFWDIATGEVTILKENRGLMSCIAFSPDGRTLASCVPENIIKLWEIK